MAGPFCVVRKIIERFGGNWAGDTVQICEFAQLKGVRANLLAMSLVPKYGQRTVLTHQPFALA
ncbi:hypothetical protein DVR01_00785 [Limosilactobacillus fermentum]|nr:hypothetical protein DVR01_00785 [Limosilactobacillus fermentum]